MTNKEKKDNLMDVNVFLFNEDVYDFKDCYNTKRLPFMPSCKSSFDLGCEYEARYHVSKEKTPTWYKKVQPLVQNGTEVNFTVQSKALVFILKIKISKTKTRFFAITYGYGRGLINKDKIEYDFGIISCLNCIDENKIKELYKRNIDTQTKSSKEAFSTPVIFDLFDFEKTADIVSRISGSCSQELNLGIKMSGADSVKLTAEIKCQDMPKKCLELYISYRKNDYKKRFPFIDYVKYEKDKTVIQELERILWDQVDQKNRTHLALAYTNDELNLFDVYGVRYRSKDKEEIFNDLTIENLYEFIDNHCITKSQLKDISIVALNQDDIPLTDTEKLRKYIVLETELNKKHYILSNGKWYKINKDYAKKIDAEVDHLYEKYKCKTPVLKEWTRVINPQNGKLRYHETSYNKTYSGQTGFSVIDCKLFGRAVEAADLYFAPENKLICIKRWHASATLSHLFQQAYVSGKLIIEDEGYKKAVCDQLNISESEIRQSTYVLAIGTDKPTRKISKLLPLFSKITLKKCVKEMMAMGYGAEIYLLPMK